MSKMTVNIYGSEKRYSVKELYISGILGEYIDSEHILTHVPRNQNHLRMDSHDKSHGVK